LIGYPINPLNMDHLDRAIAKATSIYPIAMGMILGGTGRYCQYSTAEENGKTRK
jgi:hypothetical protein